MTPPRYLIVKAKGGFGNRILSATTGIVLAELTGRTAVIDWRDGGYLPKGEDAYPLLFENPVPDVSVNAFDARTDVAPAVWAGRLAQHPVDVISQLFPNDHSNPFIYRRLSVDLVRPHVPESLAVFWSYLPKMARIRRNATRSALFHGMCNDDLTHWALARYFRPNERIRSEVATLFAGRRRPVIGVHIRYTDRKVPLDRIFAGVMRLREKLPDASIFLATDNEHIQAMFLKRFFDVFVIDKKLADEDAPLHDETMHSDPVREAENALIDMWALAQCDWLVHSRVSTFSVAAALIGRIPTSRQYDVDRWSPAVVIKRWIQMWA